MTSASRRAPGLWTARAGHQAHFGVSSKRPCVRRQAGGDDVDWSGMKKSPVAGRRQGQRGRTFLPRIVSLRFAGEGARARPSHDYITREGQDPDGGRDPAIYTE